MSLLIAPIIKPLQSRESIQREKLSRSSNLASDTVAGLRILRGIGGEESFLARFRLASQEVRAAAVRTAKMRSLLEGMQIILPGSLIVGVIWAGGTLVAEGELKVGELLAFYGYSSFLMVPLQIMTESAQRITSAVVAARRVIRLLMVENLHSWGTAQAPNISGELRDELSGISILPGEFIGIVCDDALTADDICDRLGGYLDADKVFIANQSLQSFTRESIRSAIFSQEKEPAILSGTINSHFDVPATKRISIDAALLAASAMDILDSLDGDGYSAEVVERGRTLSGGQRQRLSLARSLYVDAPILILDDPTSAVDAHTEARIAAQLREVRNHQTTIIFTTSPLILDHTDRAILLVNGRVKNTGRHQDLLNIDNNYRELVVRGE